MMSVNIDTMVLLLALFALQIAYVESQTTPLGLPCDSNPCQNGGTCKNRQVGTQNERYKCNCPDSYEGVNCETFIGFPCASDPCQNGGTCRNRESNSRYTCSCRDGYTGTNCQASEFSSTLIPPTPTSMTPVTPVTTDKPEALAVAGVTYEQGILIAMGLIILIMFVLAVVLLFCLTRKNKEGAVGDACSCLPCC